MRNNILEVVDSRSKRNDINVSVGDNVKVHVFVKEGAKERIQIFEGLVLSIKNEGASKSFTVRKMSYGIGVERTFPINSPIISEVEILRRNKIRRSKLYYMRGRQGKAARMKELGEKVVQIPAAKKPAAKKPEPKKASPKK